jgi:LuxR family maltose regulon positive regulatory protein
MTQQILSTKLYFPSTQPIWVKRNRLIDKLNNCFNARLTVVSAPAGFGKTTLLSEWIEQSEYPVGWVSLDQGDNDPKRFHAYIIAALQQIQPGFGSNTETIIKSPQQVPPENIVTALINEIGESLKKSVLILDDYHLIDSPLIHQSLSFFIEHLPDNLHLIIAGRHDPPIPLSKLRTRKQLYEIREADLRFTTDETVNFFNVTMDLDLTKDEVDTLEERTEGWIASLQLAGIAMQGRNNIHDFIKSFKGSHSYIVDYLTEEVINHLDLNLQEFLLYTSILTRFNSSLCDAVIAGLGSQDIIDYLNKAKLFIVPLDENRKWFRYHHLFSDLLRYRLEQLFPDIIPNLHKRASKWFKENNFTEDAINHSLAAGDKEGAADLIEASSISALVNAELTTLRNWAQKIPQEILNNRAYILICLAWVHNIYGEFEKTEPLLTKVEFILNGEAKRYDEKSRRDLSAHVALLRSYSHSPYYTNNPSDVEAQRKLILEAKKFLNADNTIMQSTLELLLGWTFAFTGNWKEAKESFMNAFVFGEMSNNHIVALNGVFNYVDILLVEGKLQQAHNLIRESIDKYETRYGKRFLSLGYVYLIMSRILYELNDLDTSDYYASECLRLSKLMGNWTMFFHAITMLQYIKQTKGDISSVRQLIKEDDEALNVQNLSHFRELVIETQRVKVLLAQKNFKAVAKWQDRFNNDSMKDIPYHTSGKLLGVRFLIATGNYASAIELLNAIEEHVTSSGAKGFLLEVLILKAIIYHKEKDTFRALELLKDAIIIAEPEGYLRIFINEGKTIADLFNIFLSAYSQEKDFPMSYVTKLLEEINKQLAKPDQPVEEPLSDREIEVLRLLSAGYSNKEIADKLFLAIGTIKKHTHQIYQKLNVDSRVRAIQTARELNLI